MQDSQKVAPLEPGITTKRIATVCDNVIFAIVAVLAVDAFYGNLSLLSRVELMAAVPVVFWLTLHLRKDKKR